MNSENWIQTNLGDTEYFQPQGTGITPFAGTKDYLSTSSVDGNKITSIEEAITYRSRPSRANLQPQPNTVWFARMRETHKVLSTSQYLRDHAILSTGFCGIQSEQIDTVYLKQYLSSDFFERQKDRYAEGSTQVALSNIQLPLIKIQFPKSKPEQSKIAEVLSKVDQAIEQTESLIAKQQRIKTGLMQDLLTRGIDEHGNLRSEETHEFKDSPLGRIPVEWEVDKLESVSDFITSGSRGWACYYSEDGAIFIRIGNLTRKHIHMRLDDVVYVNPPLTSEGKRTAVNAGDLLISITADLGIIAVIPDEFPEAYVNQHIALVRLNKSKIVPSFAGWFLAGYRGQSQFGKLNESGAKAGLNLPTVKSLLVPRLDISEQEQIVKTLEANICSLNGYQSQLSKLRSLKTALMQDLLTGKVRVTPLLENMEVID